ncbi:MAG: 4-hydroxy-3-methylbut-2-en-1-yl diphosphate synthase, partial [Candidatus Cloacimonadota bacterium]
CVVNGPGEARMADVGIAGGKGMGVVFRKGKIVKSVVEEKLFDALLSEIEKMVNSKK